MCKVMANCGKMCSLKRIAIFLLNFLPLCLFFVNMCVQEQVKRQSPHLKLINCKYALSLGLSYQKNHKYDVFGVIVGILGFIPSDFRESLK